MRKETRAHNHEGGQWSRTFTAHLNILIYKFERRGENPNQTEAATEQQTAQISKAAKLRPEPRQTEKKAGRVRPLRTSFPD